MQSQLQVVHEDASDVGDPTRSLPVTTNLGAAVPGISGTYSLIPVEFDKNVFGLREGTSHREYLLSPSWPTQGAAPSTRASGATELSLQIPPGLVLHNGFILSGAVFRDSVYQRLLQHVWALQEHLNRIHVTYVRENPELISLHPGSTTSHILHSFFRGAIADIHTVVMVTRTALTTLTTLLSPPSAQYPPPSAYSSSHGALRTSFFNGMVPGEWSGTQYRRVRWEDWLAGLECQYVRVAVLKETCAPFPSRPVTLSIRGCADSYGLLCALRRVFASAVGASPARVEIAASLCPRTSDGSDGSDVRGAAAEPAIYHGVVTQYVFLSGFSFFGACWDAESQTASLTDTNIGYETHASPFIPAPHLTVRLEFSFKETPDEGNIKKMAVDIPSVTMTTAVVEGLAAEVAMSATLRDPQGIAITIPTVSVDNTTDYKDRFPIPEIKLMAVGNIPCDSNEIFPEPSTSSINPAEPSTSSINPAGVCLTDPPLAAQNQYACPFLFTTRGGVGEQESWLCTTSSPNHSQVTRGHGVNGDYMCVGTVVLAVQSPLEECLRRGLFLVPQS